MQIALILIRIGHMFTTKIRATGQLFMATNEVDEEGILGRDAHELRQGKRYGGHLFLDSNPLASPWVEFSEAKWAVFRAEELEDFPAELRLIRF